MAADDECFFEVLLLTVLGRPDAFGACLGKAVVNRVLNNTKMVDVEGRH